MIIAQMIARNEEGRFLHDVLKRLSEQVDLIVFTDDCSDDNTMDIAIQYDAVTFRTKEPTFVKHEGQLRQEAWNNMSKFASKGDWILAIDADEEFYPPPNLEELLEQERFHVLGVTFFHMWNETHYRVDKAWKPTVSSRLFRFMSNGKFKDRRLACGSEPAYVEQWIRRRQFYPSTQIRMKHLGYIRDEDKQAKHTRYMDLDRGDFHSLRHIESIMDPNPKLMEWKD